jgi:hypothetical protein
MSTFAEVHEVSGLAVAWWWCRTAAADRDDWKFLDLGFSDEEKILTVRGDGYTELTKGESSPAPQTRLFHSSRTQPTADAAPGLSLGRS